MLGPLGARKGDTLVMLAASDLGRGREVQKVKDAVASLGVKIVTPDKPTKYNKPGRPRKLVPTPAQDRKIRALYRSFLTMGHVLNRASEIMGYDVKRHQLLYRYGNRWPDQ